MPKSHTHGKDTEVDTVIVGYLITYDGTAGGIHDEPDVCFNATYFDIGFIGGKYFAELVIVIVNERLNTDSSGFAVVGYLLMLYRSFRAWEVFLRDRPKLIWRVRHKDIT